jgi:hypothetical protein
LAGWSAILIPLILPGVYMQVEEESATGRAADLSRHARLAVPLTFVPASPQAIFIL